MDFRMRQDLDRHITGNYGEDQFRGMCECRFPEAPKDQQEFICHECGTIWNYRPAEDEWEAVGEEVECDEPDIAPPEGVS